MLKQRTLKSVVRSTGVGLHSGAKVSLALRPAQPDTGILFRRIDLPRPVDVPALATLVSDARLCSTLENDGARVATVCSVGSAWPRSVAIMDRGDGTSAYVDGLTRDHLVIDYLDDATDRAEGGLSISLEVLIETAAMRGAPMAGAWTATRGWPRAGILAVLLVLAAAVLAYALVLFLPAVDLFMAISGATGRLAP